MLINFHRNPLPDQRGLSLIELMVAIVIGLIATIIIAQVFSASESYKRTTTSGSDAQQSGSFAAYSMERTLRVAGAGFARLPEGGWGCLITAFRSGTTIFPTSGLSAPFNSFHNTAGSFQPRLAPIIVIDGGGGATARNPDKIFTVAGQSNLLNTPVSVTTTPTADEVVAPNNVGYIVSDLILAAEPTGGAIAPGNCTIAQASAVPAAPPITITGSIHTGPTGLSTHTNGARITNLGNSPIIAAYAVNETSRPHIQVYDFLSGETGNLADNIVSIQALYGVSGGPALNPIIAWVAPTGVWSAATLTTPSIDNARSIASIRAVRLALVARNSQPEKENVSSNTLTLFLDMDASLQETITIDPKYHYKVYDITIPLRNMLLMNNE